MAKITYVGRHEGGIHLPSGVEVAHGATVDVDDDVAADLCGRTVAGAPQWVPAKKQKTIPDPTVEES